MPFPSPKSLLERRSGPFWSKSISGYKFVCHIHEMLPCYIGNCGKQTFKQYTTVITSSIWTRHNLLVLQLLRRWFFSLLPNRGDTLHQSQQNLAWIMEPHALLHTKIWCDPTTGEKHRVLFCFLRLPCPLDTPAVRFNEKQHRHLMTDLDAVSAFFAITKALINELLNSKICC